MTEQNNPQDQQPQRNWLDAFEDKIHEANAFDRLLRALADTVSGFAASVGSVIPVITAVVVASAYMLSGVPFIVSLGAATAEFVGMYIHHDYRNRALTWWGNVVYYLASAIVGLNIAGALFHMAYPTMYDTAVAYNVDTAVIESLAFLNVLAIVTPVATSFLAILAYLTISRATQEARQREVLDGLEADKIALEGERQKATLTHARDMDAVQAATAKQRVEHKAELERQRQRHEHHLNQARIQFETDLARMRVAADREAYQDVLHDPAVQEILRRLALADLIKRMQQDSTISTNSPLWRQLQTQLARHLLPDSDRDGIADLLEDLDLSPLAASRRRSRPNGSGANGDGP